MTMLSTSTCIFIATIITSAHYISSALNNTVFTTTSDTSTSAFYTLQPINPTAVPSSAPTLKYPTQRPTVNGAFPFIHYVQSNIECDRNIALQDNNISTVYTEFTLLQTISNIKITFLVCKSSSTFHQYDKLLLWEGDDDNSTEWNITEISQYSPSGYCTIFDPSINTLYQQTYFIGLERYNNEYGSYSIYMKCDDNSYNQYIEAGEYNDYIIPQFDESKITLIGSISCGITLISSVTRDDWSSALNRQQFYSFTVTNYTQWIQLSTCDKLTKRHSISLYYISGGHDYAIMSQNTDSCSNLEKYYLLPATYYVSIGIRDLLWNDYTLNMQCSSMDSIVNVTDYRKYILPTAMPTKGPIVSVVTTSTTSVNDSQNNDTSAETIGMYVALIVAVGLCIGILIAYRKYKRKHSKSDISDNKIAAANNNPLEMAKRVTSNGSDITDESNDESDDNSDKSQSDTIIAAAAPVGGGEGEKLINMEGDGKVNSDNNNKTESHEQVKVDDAAAPAFAHIDFEAAPPMVEALPVEHYDEIDNTAMNDNDLNQFSNSDSDVNDGVNDGVELPNEQYEMGVGSYCYVDNNDNVFGIIKDELQYDFFMIIDFFEKRKRKCHKKSLTLIQNGKDYKRAKGQYYKYKKSKLNKRKKSINK